MTGLGHTHTPGAQYAPSAAERSQGVPTPRFAPSGDWLAALDHAHARLLESAATLDEDSVRLPSLLPGWSRAHVLTHLARNADALVNLLNWAKTGVEQPMYYSKADRDADIEEGAERPHQVLREDLLASGERFSWAVRTLPITAWSAQVTSAQGTVFLAHEIPHMRLLEVWVHLVDLDHDVRLADIPEPDLHVLLERAIDQFRGREDVPAMRLTADFGTTQSITWKLEFDDPQPAEISGPAWALLGWLLGRTSGEELHGGLPALPVWL